MSEDDRILHQLEHLWKLRKEHPPMLPKPLPRYKATQKAWQHIREQLAQEKCWVCGEAWTDLHHIYPRSRSGDDVLGNLAPVCRHCHGLIEARDPQARAAIRARLGSTNFSYLSYRIGRETWKAWLDKNYEIKEAA